MCANSGGRGVSVFALKLLALSCMLIDHTAYVLWLEGWRQTALYILLRGIGRLAFPIYCFLLVNGFEKSRDREGYLLRLVLFALISQLPFTLAFTVGNHGQDLALSPPGLRFTGWLPLLALTVAAGLYWFFRRESRKRFAGALCLSACLLLPAVELRLGGICLLAPSLNVFYTLALGLSLLWLTESLAKRSLRPAAAVIASALALGALLLVQPMADYGIPGASLIFALYCSRSSAAQAAVICVWSAYLYLLQGGNLPFFLSACLTALAPLCYKGTRGRSMKRFFYLAYPVHLLALGLAAILI